MINSSKDYLMNENNSRYCIILTTCNNKHIKDKIVKYLLDNKLSACIQTSNVESYYHFEGNINQDKEILLKIKTRKSLYLKVENIIKKLHDYKVPQIISISIIDGDKDYLNWIDQYCQD